MAPPARRSTRLLWWLVGLVAGALPAAPGAASAEELNTTVVIIGAGLSGLAAAKTLQAKGVEYIILEARDTLGGRVREGPEVAGAFLWKPGPYIISGSQRETGEPQVIYEAATSAGVNASLELVDSKNLTVRNRSGTVVDAEVAEKFFGMRFDEALNFCLAKNEELWELGEDLDVPESIDITLEACFTEAGWRAGVTDPLELQVLEAAEWYGIDYEWATRPATLGTMWALPENEDYLPEEWFVRDKLLDTVRWLAGTVADSEALKLSQKVTKVTYSTGQVKVETEQGLVVNGNVVLCTLPLGVLQKRTVQWDPPFSEARLSGIDGMEMAVYTKVLMQFPSVWWDSTELIFVAGDYSSGLVKIILNFDHEKYYPGSKCIEMHFTAENAITVESSTPEEVETMILAELRAIFPQETIPAPNLTLVTNWTTDEYTYGSYSSFVFNYTEDDWYEMLNSINDTVFFAGEHTSENFGYMHTAYETGVTAVEEEILPALGLMSESTTDMSGDMTTTEMSGDMTTTEMGGDMSTTVMMSVQMTTGTTEAMQTTTEDGDASGARSRAAVALIIAALPGLATLRAIS